MRFSILFHHRRMPAYNSSSFFAIFFILHLLVNTYIFMSVFLAVVYNNYKKYLKVPHRISGSCWPGAATAGAGFFLFFFSLAFSGFFSAASLCGH